MTTSGKTKPVVLGTGTVNWHRSERQSDQYSSIALYDDDGEFLLNDAEIPVGIRGELVATVVESRRPAHLGDWGRGVKAKQPQVGDKFSLGRGTVRAKRIEEYGPYIALEPDDDRYTVMDVDALYSIHNQTVLLELRQ